MYMYINIVYMIYVHIICVMLYIDLLHGFCIGGVCRCLVVYRFVYILYRFHICFHSLYIRCYIYIYTIYVMLVSYWAGFLQVICSCCFTFLFDFLTWGSRHCFFFHFKDLKEMIGSISACCSLMFDFYMGVSFLSLCMYTYRNKKSHNQAVL